jgi:hypothetical protein
VYGNLYYDDVRKIFITIGKQKGLYIADTEGKILVQNIDYAAYQYSREFRLFYSLSTADGGYKADVISLDSLAGFIPA